MKLISTGREGCFLNREESSMSRYAICCFNDLCNLCIRGAFGSHVAGVLRRLVRICLYYGRFPQFLCCSATIANPAEHMMKLVPLRALHFQTSELPSGPSFSNEREKKHEHADLLGRQTNTSGYHGLELEVVGADSDGAPQGER